MSSKGKDIKFMNKYRIPSARWEIWNYGDSAAYFVTICTKNGKYYFGQIRNKKMHLSEIGKKVEEEWLKTPSIRPDMNLQLGAFVVMPNHFHAIIIIGKNKYNTKGYNKCNGDNYFRHQVRIKHLQRIKYKTLFEPQRKNLSSIIRGFKSAVTLFAKKSGYEFGWLPRFYDIVIRDNKAYYNIRNYIISNPSKWKKDKFKK